MRATKIIFWILFVLAMVLITGDWALQRFFHEKVPKVWMSSVSPDGKWICELIDLDPHASSNLMIIHVDLNKGGGVKQRAYHSEVYIIDMDSEPPSEKTEFIWEGNVVTVRNMFHDEFVKIKVDGLGSEIVDSWERQQRANHGK